MSVSTTNLKPLRRWLQSKLLTKLVSTQRLNKNRANSERNRVKNNLPHVIEYFHQVDDAYSYLASQLLKAIVERYSIELKCHLVVGPQGDNSPEPDLLLKLAQYDSSIIAPEYALEFPQDSQFPTADLVKLATSILAAQNTASFIEHAPQVGTALWSNNREELQRLAEQLGTANDDQITQKLDDGTNRRNELKHYSGAMFFYGKEWYWGVDRLYHLEQRLAELGLDSKPDTPVLIPRPAIEFGVLEDASQLTLEFFPSLRSPYTSIIFDSLIELASKTGVKLSVKPVLPMVMRGIPATREKGIYIFTDTAREARALGVNYGNFYDPIGDPVKRCYSLYTWACEQSKGNQLLSAFLKAAFQQGINTGTDSGMKQVVENAGLDWNQASEKIDQPGWETQLEENRLAMYEAGLWGVPSFRLVDQQGKQVLALWGQDRLWVVARKIFLEMNP